MMRSQRRALPLISLLGIEIAAILVLQWLGSQDNMKVPWNGLSTWLSTGSLDQIAPALLRIAGLVLAYWLFVSTALSVLAGLSHMPAAIRASNMFTLPFVRRVVDGAVVASIVSTSFVGLSGAAAFADTNTGVPLADDITTSAASMNMGATATPMADPGATNVGDVTTAGGTGTTAVGTGMNAVGTGMNADTGTNVLADGTTTTSSTSTTSSTIASNASTLTPSPSSDWVPTPEPGAPLAANAIHDATTMPQAPSTPAAVPTPAPGATAATPGIQGDHIVVAGENLWTISRDALAASTGQPASSITESAIRDYWIQVINVNRSHLRSGDPHWIFPGETVTFAGTQLPSAAGTPTAPTTTATPTPSPGS